MVLACNADLASTGVRATDRRPAKQFRTFGRCRGFMGDVLIYWRDYRKNTTEQYACWHSNSQLLGRLMPGDRMWMVTSGKNLGHEAEQAGYLVAVWQVAQAVPNPGDDPAYPRSATAIGLCRTRGSPSRLANRSRWTTSFCRQPGSATHAGLWQVRIAIPIDGRPRAGYSDPLRAVRCCLVLLAQKGDTTHGRG